MKKITFVKKIQVIPLGDKPERERIYQYYRDAQYNQYLALNQLMSEVGILYYHYKRDVKNPDFKEEYKAMFRRDNIAYDNVMFPKGGHLQGNVSRKVQADFSTALRSGLAKGEKQLPRYRRDFPYMIHNRELKFYRDEEEYNGQNYDIFCIKTVNKMFLKVVLGSRGKRDYGLMSLLNDLADKNPNYKIGQSTLYFDKHNKMMLNLTVTKTVDDTYTPVAGRTMSIAYGFNKPINIAFNDSDKTYTVGEEQTFIHKRLSMQKHYQKIQSALKESQGGRGRSHKLQALDKYHKAERNFAKNYNHNLSKQIVELAITNKVELIVVEDITKDDLAEFPILLRNWSYYELTNDIIYKADKTNITVLLGKAPETCAFCQNPLDKATQFPEDIKWSQQLSFTCPHCKQVIDYGVNKATMLAKAPII